MRPSDVIPPAATEIHGIDDPAVADAPSWDSVYPLVGRILDKYGPVVVYNADFDQRVLEQVNRLYGLPGFEVEWHCAMKRHAEFAGIWHDKYQTWRWHKLGDALSMMGKQSPATRHRAVADAESCRQIVTAMAAESTAPVPAYAEWRDAGERERDEQADREPLTPEVIQPGEEERGYDSGWITEQRSYAGGRVTVISTKSKGCSTGALLLTLFVGMVCILLGTLAFFYSAMALF